MKPIIKNENQDTILTNKITENHIVVAVIDKRPTILSKGYEQSLDFLTFFTLDNSFIIGNGHDFGKHTIKDVVECAINDNRNNKIAVFRQNDWKEALKWLIDNA